MDKFLVSQMDPQMFVPLQVIANFKKVQFLTKVLNHPLQFQLALLITLPLPTHFSGFGSNRHVSQWEHRSHS
jgi:hypothetical protein